MNRLQASEVPHANTMAEPIRRQWKDGAKAQNLLEELRADIICVRSGRSQKTHCNWARVRQ